MRSLQRFRTISMWEGISFLVLLGIAMPLKYVADQPMAVKIVGWIHGVLFILYGYFLIQVTLDQRWKFGRVILAGLAALVPFGPFLFDRSLKKELNATK